MPYSNKVLDHYENLRNVGKLNTKDSSVGTGMVGAPACGDVMRLQIKVKNNRMVMFPSCFLHSVSPVKFKTPPKEIGQGRYTITHFYFATPTDDR